MAVHEEILMVCREVCIAGRLRCYGICFESVGRAWRNYSERMRAAGACKMQAR